MPREVQFEIPAKDPDKVSAFYREVFGWQVHKWAGPEEDWRVSAGDRAAGRDSAPRTDHSPLAGTVNTVEVPDLDAVLDRIRQHEGRIFVDKMTIPGVGYLAYCKDIEGNIFGVAQSDPAAA